MRPVFIILTAAAVSAAAGTAFLAQRWMAGQAARPVTVQQAPMVEILVVARDVAIGVQITDGDLRYESWPEAMAQRFLARRNGDDPKARFVGMVARRPLSEGEPFVETVAIKLEAGLLAGLLEPGMRAVSVAISNASAVSGFISPGDRVDVVMAADFQRADQDSVGKGGPIVRYAAETVLRNVKVLAIDQQIARGKDGAAIQGKTATIEVNTKQAEVLVAAGMLGQLSLVLRPLSRQDGIEVSDGVPAKPFTADIEASAAMRVITGESKPRVAGGDPGIRINRAGSISTRSF